MIRATALALSFTLITSSPMFAQHEHHMAPVATEAEAVHIHEIPDVDLLDQNGKHVRLFSDLIEGRVVAINFIFTTCTTICPALAVQFANLQKRLGDRIGRDVFLVSVSIDPANDTPDRLAAWGRKFGAKDGWTMVTGKKDHIDAVLKAFGVYTPDFRNHQPVTLVGSGISGMWKRLYGFPPVERLTEAVNTAGAGNVHAAAGGGQR